MKGESSLSGVGNVSIIVTENRGMNPVELADLAINRIISVGNESAPEVREQALAYKSNIKDVLIKYLTDAQAHERVTICNKLNEAGLGDAAEFVKNL